MNPSSREQAEQLIENLKNQGFSKVESIVQVAAHFEMGLDAAKILVHESPVWREQRGNHEEFHEALDDALKNRQSTGLIGSDQ